MKMIMSILLIPICMASCVSYQPLTDRSTETISKELKKGDFVRLKMSYPQGPENINHLVVSEVKGDSLIVGTVFMAIPDERSRVVSRELKISQIAEISKGRTIGHDETRFLLGYNSFNEIFAGFQFPKNVKSNVVVELGYQFALSQNATYSQVANPILTTNASGLRARLGFQFPRGRSRIGIVHFEYQNLQSKPFNFYESAHSGSYESDFTESYNKYGVRFTGAIPIAKSGTVFFTYSFAVFLVHTTRKYSWERQAGMNWLPSDREEVTNTVSPQMSIGFRVYVF